MLLLWNENDRPRLGMETEIFYCTKGAWALRGRDNHGRMTSDVHDTVSHPRGHDKSLNISTGFSYALSRRGYFTC